MQLKIKKKTLLFSLLLLCISSFWGGNYLLSSLYVTDFMVTTSIAVSFIVFLSNKCRIKKSFYSLPIFFSLVMWISGIILASRYSLPISVILKESCYTIAPLMIYIAYRPLINGKDDIHSLFHGICISSVVCNVMAFVEMFFALNGTDLLKIDVFNKMRNGTPRFIFAETVMITGFFYSYAMILDKEAPRKNRKLFIFNILITMANLIFIVKTRSLLLYIIATVLMIPVLSDGISKKKRIALITIILSLLSIIVLSDFLPSLNNLIESDSGVQMRISAISYYFDYFKHHWLFGAGYISSNSLFSTASIVSGPYGKYYTSDVGLIGLMFRSGIIGVLWLLSLFICNHKLIKRSKGRVPLYYDSLMKLMNVFLVFSCINLILTDTPRFPYIALVMLIMESSCLFEKERIREEQTEAMN